MENKTEIKYQDIPESKSFGRRHSQIHSPVL